MKGERGLPPGLLLEPATPDPEALSWLWNMASAWGIAVPGLLALPLSPGPVPWNVHGNSHLTQHLMLKKNMIFLPWGFVAS